MNQFVNLFRYVFVTSFLLIAAFTNSASALTIRTINGGIFDYSYSPAISGIVNVFASTKIPHYCEINSDLFCRFGQPVVAVSIVQKDFFGNYENGTGFQSDFTSCYLQPGEGNCGATGGTSLFVIPGIPVRILVSVDCCSAENGGTYIEFTGPNPVPIPAALQLFIAGLSALGFGCWKKRQKIASFA
jgi:hypothetical protein